MPGEGVEFKSVTALSAMPGSTPLESNILDAANYSAAYFLQSILELAGERRGALSFLFPSPETRGGTMELTRRCLRVAFLASIGVLLFTAGCSSRQTGPVVGSDGPMQRGDVNVLDADDVTIPIHTMERFIANRLPGIVIRGQSIVIRGNSTFSSTNQALIVVDGRAMDTVTFLDMNPADVERIEVLRGSDAALYGRRGANGVLVVTTQ
jgi:TonB-dependent SusC/RagA subfamily outer membrane receptor